MINLIWAMDKNWLIGKDDKLPWRYREDLLYFKSKTHNKTVLMGDNTYRSLKGYYAGRKLPFLKVYVASRDHTKQYPDATQVDDVVSFLKDYKEELWVVGGSVVYNLALPYADNLYITFIEKEYEGNKHFKKFDLEKEFKLASYFYGEAKELKFCVYERV